MNFEYDIEFVSSEECPSDLKDPNGNSPNRSQRVRPPDSIHGEFRGKKFNSPNVFLRKKRERSDGPKQLNNVNLRIQSILPVVIGSVKNFLSSSSKPISRLKSNAKAEAER